MNYAAARKAVIAAYPQAYGVRFHTQAQDEAILDGRLATDVRPQGGLCVVLEDEDGDGILGKGATIAEAWLDAHEHLQAGTRCTW